MLLFDRIVSHAVDCQVMCESWTVQSSLPSTSMHLSVTADDLSTILELCQGFTCRITGKESGTFLCCAYRDFLRLEELVNNYIKFMCGELSSPTPSSSCQKAARARLLSRGRWERQQRASHSRVGASPTVSKQGKLHRSRDGGQVQPGVQIRQRLGDKAGRKLSQEVSL